MEKILVHFAESLQRTAGSKLRVSLQSIEEHTFVDIRIFMWREDEQDYVASKKGCTIPIRLMPRVIEILQDIKLDRKPIFLKERKNENSKEKEKL